jgi:hypothetical protein
MQKEKYQSQINQNCGTIYHTEVCLTFSRLAGKLSRMIAKVYVTSMTSDLNLLTSMASKTALPYISKIASNQCICSKD